ncbi:MAG: hypothetical protein JHC46_02950, partial [Solirubrobacteraceae bacterium]|nr:hypothetical protein [Solirubrobacteraceae bacterium]
ILGLRAAQRLSPAENGVLTDGVLDWAPVPGAATYDIQVDDDNNFSSPVVDLTGLVGTRYARTRTLDNDTYYWRVRPVDASGNARPWTEEDRGTFQRAWPGQPRLQYPADGATVGDPFYYQWSPSERTSTSQEDLALASSYTLEVATSPTFQGSVMRCDTTLTTWVPRTTNTCWPQASGTYYWRVIGHDDYSTGRPTTDTINAEVRSFTYSPTVPQLVAPVNGATVSVPTLDWSPVAGAARYRVSITGGAGFEEVRVRGEELLANWFGWTNRALEATAAPEDVPMFWRQYAFRGYLALQKVDRSLLEGRLPATIFYNLLLSARRPD